MIQFFKALFFIFLIVLTGCQSTENQAHDDLIFNGKDLTGWHIYNQGNIPSKWKVSDGELICDPKSTGVFGDIITDQEYENFELEFEWKVSKGGNSGVFINVKEDAAYAATFATGLEMQLLDNKNAEPRHQVDSTHWAGCLYAVDCLGSASKPKPFNEWNQGKIRQENGQVTFWLNDQITFQDDVLSSEFREKVSQTNMVNYPGFGTFKKGKIAFQNHTDSVGFRNILLRKL
ncbi:3-keto-disaccharide hydrolase [Sphingobacterium sp. HJSM2_6]|uniref:3-keto-disaccharide hydrolase n=1 Tax=Sphingobacterium sp. HJSM2_6 TaxID=3366264 RepID=UPI003BE284B6